MKDIDILKQLLNGNHLEPNEEGRARDLVWAFNLRLSSNNTKEPMRYVNLYDDEDEDFIIKTDCPAKVFKKILDAYRRGKIKGFEEYDEDVDYLQGYNYDDFFKILRCMGYTVEVIKTKERYYF